MGVSVRCNARPPSGWRHGAAKQREGWGDRALPQRLIGYIDSSVTSNLSASATSFQNIVSQLPLWLPFWDAVHLLLSRLSRKSKSRAAATPKLLAGHGRCTSCLMASILFSRPPSHNPSSIRIFYSAGPWTCVGCNGYPPHSRSLSKVRVDTQLRTCGFRQLRISEHEIAVG